MTHTHYPLQKPITRKIKSGDTVTEEVITSLPIKELVAEDMTISDAYEGGAEKTLHLIAHMTGLTRAEAGRLSIKDMKALNGIIESF